MNGQLQELIEEIERANLAEEEVQQLWRFVQFLTYQRHFQELPLAVFQTAEEHQYHQSQLHVLHENQGELVYDVTFTEEEYDGNPLLRLIGLAEHGHLADDIDGELYG